MVSILFHDHCWCGSGHAHMLKLVPVCEMAWAIVAGEMSAHLCCWSRARVLDRSLWCRFHVPVIPPPVLFASEEIWVLLRKEMGGTCEQRSAPPIAHAVHLEQTTPGWSHVQEERCANHGIHTEHDPSYRARPNQVGMQFAGVCGGHKHNRIVSTGAAACSLARLAACMRRRCEGSS